MRGPSSGRNPASRGSSTDGNRERIKGTRSIFERRIFQEGVEWGFAGPIVPQSAAAALRQLSSQGTLVTPYSIGREISKASSKFHTALCGRVRLRSEPALSAAERAGSASLRETSFVPSTPEPVVRGRPFAWDQKHENRTSRPLPWHLPRITYHYENRSSTIFLLASTANSRQNTFTYLDGASSAKL